MDPKLIWLATQHAVDIDGQRINVSTEATSPLVRKSLTDCGRQAALGPSIIGLMRVRVAASIDCMTVLTGSEREQLRFWNGVLDKDLASAGMAYRFEVVSVAELPQQMPMVPLQPLPQPRVPEPSDPNPEVGLDGSLSAPGLARRRLEQCALFVFLSRYASTCEGTSSNSGQFAGQQHWDLPSQSGQSQRPRPTCRDSLPIGRV